MTILLTTFLTIAFFSVLFFFGWQVARLVLRENRIERLTALGGIFGIGLYIFFLNAIGFFMPIQTAFYAVLYGFLLSAIVGFFWRRLRTVGHQESLEWGIDGKWRKILLIVSLFFVISTGSISFRHPMDLFTLREPTAMTMVEGNFPPKEIWSPDNLLQYHYAPDLFSAAIYKVTGMPLYLAYDFQKAILSGVIFLLAFILINSFFPSVFVAFWSSVLMFYSGSLVFLGGLGGVPTLFDKYILGKEVLAPFKFVTDAIGEASGLPVVNYVIGVHWGAMAFALMLVVVYIYFHLLNSDETGNRWPAIFVAGFMLALLALVAESFFVALTAVLFVFPFVSFLFNRHKEMLERKFVISFFILLLAVPMAIFQGGVLKSAVYQQLHISKSGNGNEVMLYTEKKLGISPIQFGISLVSSDEKPKYDIVFLARWVLLFAILVPAFFFLFRQSFELAAFLLLVVILFFAPPLLLHSEFKYINENLERFFYPVNLFGGLVAGLFLATSYINTHRLLLKRVLLSIAIILMAQGLWTQFVWLSFGYPPGGLWNPNLKFFAEANTFEAVAYRWVKENTIIRDRFLIIRDEYSECGFSGAPNCLFIFNTGRMAPIFRWHQAIRIEDEAASHKIDQFEEIRKNCDSAILRELGFNYIYVDERWSKGMEAKCLQDNKLDLVFKNSDGGKFVRIYSIKKP